MVGKNKTMPNFKKWNESDNTPQQINEEELKNSELRYRRLFEAAQDAILILDGENGHIIDANPFVQSLLGYSLSELIGKKLWEISPLKISQKIRNFFKNFKKKHTSAMNIFHFKRRINS